MAGIHSNVGNRWFCLFLLAKFFTHETIAYFPRHQVEVNECGRCGFKVVIVNLCDWQAEILHLVVTRIEALQHGVVSVYPPFRVLLNIEVHHPHTAYRDIALVCQNLYIGILA